MIKISSAEYQLRQNRKIWLFIGGVSSVGGLLIWSVVPFAANDLKNPNNVWFRYAALIGSLGCGISAVMAGTELERIAPQIRALNKAEKEDFLNQLATAQYIQLQRYDMEAQQALKAETHPPVSAGETLRQDSPSQSTSQLTDSTSGVGSSDVEGYRALFQSVSLAKSQGATDTEIIEKVLGLGGRNFSQGKKALQTLLHMGQQQGW